MFMQLQCYNCMQLRGNSDKGSVRVRNGEIRQLQMKLVKQSVGNFGFCKRSMKLHKRIEMKLK